MGNVAHQLGKKSLHERHRVQKPTTVLVEKGRITKGEIMLLVLMAIVFFAVSIIAISNYASINSINRDIHHYEMNLHAKTDSIEELQLQVTELSEPSRILNIAQKHSGLEFNEENVKVVIE